MTDNEIIKGLECHKERELATCEICPLLNIEGCAYKLSEYALDLINRQKAEIERLKAENQRFADIGKMYSEIKAEAVKEFAERLKKRSNYFHTSGGHSVWEAVTVYDIDKLVKEMVGEQRKEDEGK